MSARDEILGADDLRVEVVDTPEWGRPIRLRQLNGLDLMAYEDSLPEKANTTQLSARIIAFTAIDDDGNRLFSEADIPALERKNPKALLRLGSRAMLMNRLTDSELQAAEKKSGPSRGESSYSTSVSSWAMRIPIVSWLVSRRRS